MIDAPILITGGSGQIGKAVARLAMARGIAYFAPPRSVLDLSDGASISRTLQSESWRAVINCAAYTAVDRAESDREMAEQVNAFGTAFLARETADKAIPIIHVSTDYVFDGTKGTPYVEDDSVNPLCVYGHTKLQGEEQVRRLNPHHAVIRTAWVQSASGANFVNTMITKGSELSQMRVVDDQIGCPSSADDIADALLAVVPHLGERSGTWHFVNTGEASWHQLADHVFRYMALRGMHVPSLQRIQTSEYPTPAKRPANSRLSTRKFEQDFGIKPRSWHEAIDEILAERLS